MVGEEGVIGEEISLMSQGMLTCKQGLAQGDSTLSRLGEKVTGVYYKEQSRIQMKKRCWMTLAGMNS